VSGIGNEAVDRWFSAVAGDHDPAPTKVAPFP